jgi:hypothetical protein
MLVEVGQEEEEEEASEGREEAVESGIKQT